MTIVTAPAAEADFLVENHGSVMLFTARSAAAVEKLGDLGLEGWQMMGPHRFAIERRVSAALAAVLSDEGFTFADA